VFDRTIHLSAYTFDGIDYNAYTDISYITNTATCVGNWEILFTAISGESDNISGRNNKANTAGIYAQHTLDATDKVKLESGCASILLTTTI
jgi:iron complex outermembrane receptor protein/outer membrane receptor for ferrienterochelin and colicins